MSYRINLNYGLMMKNMPVSIRRLIGWDRCEIGKYIGGINLGEIRVGRYSADVIVVEGEKCLLMSWHDITDIKNAEALLRQDKEQLESKGRATDAGINSYEPGTAGC